MNPKVSIIMPTYNTNKVYLRQAINSILNQSYSNFEFIIIDDSSIDDYEFIQKEFRDKRINLIKNSENLGVARTLNRGLAIASGDFILRMDSDDISYKNRIITQLNYLVENPSIDIVGSAVKFIGKKTGTRKFPRTHDEIKANLLFGSPFVHPSVMIRASIFRDFRLFYDDTFKSEDYELWTRCAMNPDVRFHNLSDVLLKYRLHEGQVTKSSRNKIKDHSDIIREKYLHWLGFDLNEKDMDLFNRFSRGSIDFKYADFIQIDKILLTIVNKPEINNEIGTQTLKKVVTKKMLREYFRKIKSLDKSVKSYKQTGLLEDKISLKLIIGTASLFCNK